MRVVFRRAAAYTCGMKADWFGPRLQELRNAKGWTQQQLADAAGLAVGVVRKLERRENKPTWETALALADALGVSCEAFTQPPAERPPARPGRPPKMAPPPELPKRGRPRKAKAGEQ
jgi:transcriptional regulator with XRE-family HTH domain